MTSIDLNADLGEGFGSWELGDDTAMLGLVSSASIACGFHAGDPLRMLRTVREAARRGVAIGAHVSYRDLAGFGRRFMAVPPDELEADVLYQLSALAGIASSVGVAVSYVKPHGALYNAIVSDEEQARAVVAAVAASDRGLSILGLPGSAVLRIAQDAGLPTISEAFADRGYTKEGTLVPRGAEGAVLTDPAIIAERVLRLVERGEVLAVTGEPVRSDARSICLHGDTPGAVRIATEVRRRLVAAGVTVAPVRS